MNSDEQVELPSCKLRGCQRSTTACHLERNCNQRKIMTYFRSNFTSTSKCNSKQVCRNPVAMFIHNWQKNMMRSSQSQSPHLHYNDPRCINQNNHHLNLLIQACRFRANKNIHIPTTLLRLSFTSLCSTSSTGAIFF